MTSMQVHKVRNLKGKLLYAALTCTILLIGIKTSLRRSQVQQQPQVQRQFTEDSKVSPYNKLLQKTEALDLSLFDLSYLENVIEESSDDISLSSETSESELYHLIRNLSAIGWTDDIFDNSSNLPSFTVNHTSNRFQHGCYERGIIKEYRQLLPKTKLKELHCEQRPPEAIVFGVKKGGTTTLKEFLAFHPDVSVAPQELKFLNTNSLNRQGLSKYASLMPYSLPDQIPIEKTPGYLVRPRCADVLKEMIPNCKLVAILSDPVRRAISDFVHLSWVRDHRGRGATELLPKHAHQIPHYEVKSTFEESVLYPNGSVKAWNTLIDTGLYYKYAKYWLNFFPPENFLYLDSYDLVNDPVKSFKELESFLGLSPFFSEEVFHFNETKGFYCIQYPVYSCMPSAKGRPHPVVSDNVIKKLREFFEPHNIEFSKLFNKTFSWTTYSDL